ncbi:hypothetical protein FQA39_LY14725 [Lamprigera yunnana]|nr:hypothetical protein FQA39_LY14725 [Lamprigera yunnana]
MFRHRNKDYFIVKHSGWLDINLNLPGTIVEKSSQRERDEPSTSKNRGRPKKVFGECSDRGKQKKIQPLVGRHIGEELLYAAKYTLHSSNKQRCSDNDCVSIADCGIKEMKPESVDYEKLFKLKEENELVEPVDTHVASMQ